MAIAKHRRRRGPIRVHAMDCSCHECAPLSANAIALRCLAGVGIALLLITIFSALTGAPGPGVMIGIGS